jgi:hypothetical protein
MASPYRAYDYTATHSAGPRTTIIQLIKQRKTTVLIHVAALTEQWCNHEAHYCSAKLRQPGWRDQATCAFNRRPYFFRVCMYAATSSASDPLTAFMGRIFPLPVAMMFLMSASLSA